MANDLRARDLGMPFQGVPGEFNAITDVTGVEVGHTTLIAGEGPLKRGVGPIRTGVSAIWPRGKKSVDPVFGAWFSLNGNGEVTGTAWLEESGLLEGAVLLTNTHSVGLVRDAYIAWQLDHGVHDATGAQFSLPIVAETWDGYLNDINGFHVKPEHVYNALDSAAGGQVAEGNVGGGTGMICYGFKAGIGTASRKVTVRDSEFRVGILAQCNCGRRPQLLIAGVPVGQQITECVPDFSAGSLPKRSIETGSIIILIATDAPLLPHQLKRIARRATMGLARTGSVAGNSSGDMFISFSTANTMAAHRQGMWNLRAVPNDEMDPLFTGTVEATEEAIVNALVAAKTMVGANDHRAIALPHDRTRELLRSHNRLTT